MLSLIIPIRNWPAERVGACVRSFLRLKSKTLDEIVVVDFGSQPPMRRPLADKRVRIVRVDAERWSAGEAINIGVMTSRNPVIAKADADIVVARESGPGLDAAVAALAKGVIGFAVVQATDLPEGVDAKRALAADTAKLARAGRLRARWGQGGLCLFTADVWNDVGGVEARFHGWGNEDNDFPERIRRSGRRLRWIDGSAAQIFHVWHPPRYNAKDIIKARQENVQLYNGDKSTFRPVRFLSSRIKRLPAPSIVNTPRPLVTVAIASKARPGRERMLVEAIRGFVGQIGNDFEVLVANNGSTAAESARLGKSIKRLPRAIDVRVIDIREASIPAARNRLSEEARGRYVCVADDDDIPLPNRLADHLACFEKDPATHGSHGGWIDFDELTGVIDFNTGGERELSTLLFGRGKVTAHPTAFYRRDVMRALPYDESFSVGSDLDLALRMANVGCRIAHTGSYVTLRRFHDTNVTITNLAGQLTVGQEARQRIHETLGHGYEWRLKELAKRTSPVVCRNGMGKDRIVGLIPRYAGVWRLLVPLAELGREGKDDVAAPPAPTFVNGANGSAVAATDQDGDVPVLEIDAPLGKLRAALPSNGVDGDRLADRARSLAQLVNGDVGVVDCGINPGLFFVSDPVKGAAKALQLRDAIERQFGILAELVADVEYRRRHTARFDWTQLAGGDHGSRLLSRPTKDLDRVLAALARLPDNTMLRAMTSVLADFNCEDQLFRLVTTPIRGGEGPTSVKRLLERHTGEIFELLSDATVPSHNGVLS